MHNFDIITLPPSRWAEYRALRLQSLQTDPTSFATIYEEDASLPDSVWQDRLERALEGKTCYGLFAQSEGKLIGMAWALIDQGACVQHRATIVGMYVAPAFRGRGIAKKLLHDLLEKLNADPRIVHISLTVNTEAQPAINLYESLGFKIIGLLEKSGYAEGVFRDTYIMVKILNK